MYGKSIIESSKYSGFYSLQNNSNYGNNDFSIPLYGNPSVSQERRKAYDYVGVCEYIAENDGENTTEKTLTYLEGPFGVFAVVERQDNEETLHYVLKDHLGSWTIITDAEGVVEQELSFDAWGNLRNPMPVLADLQSASREYQHLQCEKSPLQKRCHIKRRTFLRFLAYSTTSFRVTTLPPSICKV